MSIGKMIAEALTEAMEETKNKGPFQPLNEATRAVHQAHKDFVEDMFPKLKQAELEFTKIKNRMDEERAEWALKIRATQPELNNVSGFEINDDNTEFRIYYDSEEERDAAQGAAEVPPWAKGISFSGKPN